VSGSSITKSPEMRAPRSSSCGAAFMGGMEPVCRAHRRHAPPRPSLAKPLGDVALEPYAHEISELRRRRDAARAPQCGLETQQWPLYQPNKRYELASCVGRKLRDCGLEAAPLLALEGRKVDITWEAQERTVRGHPVCARPSAYSEILGHRPLVATASPRYLGNRERVFWPKRLEHAIIVTLCRTCATALQGVCGLLPV